MKDLAVAVASVVLTFACATSARAQAPHACGAPPVGPHGGLLAAEGPYLAEVVYAPESVRVYVYAAEDGAPIEPDGVSGRAFLRVERAVGGQAYFQQRDARLRRVPADPAAGRPHGYLEASHRLGSLRDGESLRVDVSLRDLPRRDRREATFGVRRDADAPCGGCGGCARRRAPRS